MVKFGLLTAEICWRVWGTPANFNGFSRLGSVTARHSSSGRQPNFAAVNRGHYLYLAGRPSRWALARILVFLSSPVIDLCTLTEQTITFHILFNTIISCSLWMISQWSSIYIHHSIPFCYFGQGSSLPRTPTRRPFVSRPNALAQEGRRLVDDVCECKHDVQGKEGLSRREQLCQVLVTSPF